MAWIFYKNSVHSTLPQTIPFRYSSATGESGDRKYNHILFQLVPIQGMAFGL